MFGPFLIVHNLLEKSVLWLVVDRYAARDSPLQSLPFEIRGS